jgi:hypothetical protein
VVTGEPETCDLTSWGAHQTADSLGGGIRTHTVESTFLTRPDLCTLDRDTRPGLVLGIAAETLRPRFRSSPSDTRQVVRGPPHSAGRRPVLQGVTNGRSVHGFRRLS